MEENNDKIRRLIITSFFIIILLGVPLWWKTTEVYRAQLPFTEIEEWSNWEVSIWYVFFKVSQYNTVAF